MATRTVDPAKLKSLEVFYENLAAETEHSGMYYGNPLGLLRKKRVLSLLDAEPGQVICDIGCGDGDLSKGLLGIVKEVYGIDISPTRVERARARGIKAVSGDAADTPFEQGQFDRVICSEVIEHIVDPVSLMVEIHRILKDGGIAVLTVPYSQEIEATLLDVPNEDLENMPYREIVAKYNVTGAHLNSFTEEKFRDMLENAGLVVEKVEYTYKFEQKFRVKKIYSAIPFIKVKLRTADNFKGLNRFLDKLVNMLFSPTEEKGHIIARVSRRTT